MFRNVTPGTMNSFRTGSCYSDERVWPMAHDAVLQPCKRERGAILRVISA
jgi:hypothetical protein